jgi:sugar phosphate permease
MVFATVFYLLVPFYYECFGTFGHGAVIVFMSLNGFFQSTGWPGVVGIMGNWFQKGKTGLILGIWAINANIGNIIAELMCNILKGSFNASWTSYFYSTGIFTIIVAILIFLFLEDKPKEEKGKFTFYI